MKGKLMNKPFFTLLIFVIMFFCSILLAEEKNTLQTAYQTYLMGEKAEVVSDRVEAFNKALADYTELEKQYPPNPKLYFNIANNYFQLGEYGSALLYYYRAERLAPRDEQIQSHIKLAQNKAKVSANLNPFKPANFFSLGHLLVLNERMYLFAFFTIVATIAGSIVIWEKSKYVKTIRNISLAFALVFLASVTYSYFSKPQAVLIQSSLLTCDAGEQYAPITKEPVLNGQRVRVLGCSKDGLWLKVELTTGEKGYISYKVARII